MPQFQYQWLAEPSAAAGTVERTQVDKWYVQASEPPRQLRRELTFHSDLAYGEGVFVKETAQLDKWWRQTSEPPRPLPWLPSREALTLVSAMDPHLDATAHFFPDYLRPLPRELYGHSETAQAPWFAASQEIVQLGKWWRQTSEPPRALKRLPDAEALRYGEGVFTKETTQVDKWWVQASEPTRNLRRVLYGVGDITFVIEITLLTKWWQPTSEPPRALKRLTDVDALRYGEGVFTKEIAQLDKWWQTASLPVRPAQRIAPIAEGYSLFWAVLAAVFNPNTGFPYEQASEPPRSLKRLTDVEALRYGEGVFVKETTTADRWYQPASLPVRAPRFQAPFAYSVLVPELIFLDKWWQPTSLPVRTARFQAPFTYSVVTTEITALDKWWQPASLPIRPVQRIVPSMLGAFVSVTTFSPATGFPWEQASESPRFTRRLTDMEALRYGEGVFVKETTSVDRWYQLANVPIRRGPSWVGDSLVPVFVLGMNVPVEFPFPEYHWVIPKQDTRYPYLEMAAPFIHSIPETQPVQALAWWGLTQQEGAWGVD